MKKWCCRCHNVWQEEGRCGAAHLRHTKEESYRDRAGAPVDESEFLTMDEQARLDVTAIVRELVRARALITRVVAHSPALRNMAMADLAQDAEEIILAQYLVARDDSVSVGDVARVREDEDGSRFFRVRITRDEGSFLAGDFV